MDFLQHDSKIWGANAMRSSGNFCVALILCLAPGAWSQQPAGTGMENAGGDAGVVRLNVVVTDKSGKPVAGLGAGDFTLLDNKQPAKILSFQAYGASRTPNPPVEVIILFDAVNTGFGEVSMTRQQVEAFLRQNGGRLAQPVALYFLTDEGVQVQKEPTTDGNGLAADLQATESRLRILNRSAGAWGAIERFDFSVKMLTEVTQSLVDKPGRKLLIWAGPGWPMLDGPDVNIGTKGQKEMFENIVGLNTMLRMGQVDVYSVSQGMPGAMTYAYQSYLKGVKKVNQVNPPDLGLKVIAVQSGGLALSPNNDLTGSIDTCVQDAGAYYTITFRPPPADGPNEYHELKVKVVQAGLTARTNTGYYDQPGMTAAP